MSLVFKQFYHVLQDHLRIHSCCSFLNAAIVASPVCSYHHIANAGDSCNSIAYHTGITLQNIHCCNSWISPTWNSIVARSNVIYLSVTSAGCMNINYLCWIDAFYRFQVSVFK